MCIRDSDIISRHMRFRRGAQDVFFRDEALGGNCVGNVSIDHCSASWGLDENMSVYRHVYNRDSTGHGLKPVSYTHLDVYKRQMGWLSPD